MMRGVHAVSAVPFFYGRGVFESIPVREGRAVFPDWHREAMVEAAQTLGLDDELIRPPAVPGATGVWRWLLDPSGFRTTWQEGLEPVPDSVSAGISPLSVMSRSWEARYKTYSYLLMVQAREIAAGGWTVLGNENGQVACATMANVFWVVDGAVQTPHRCCGCRAGTARRWVMEQSGCEVTETAAAMAILDEAEEIFLTNARIGVLPVREWNGQRKETRLGAELRRLWEKCLRINRTP